MVRIPAHNFIDKDDYFETLTKKISLKNFKNICLCYISNPVVIKMLIEKFNNCNITVIDLGYICNKIKKAFPNVEVIANDFQNDSDNKDEEPIVNIFKNINAMFDLIIANPPYSIGSKVITEVVSHLSDNGTASVLMPLSQYKKNLHKHVENFELVDPKLFKDAVITENLCICTLRKKEINKYSWMDLVLGSVDQRYIEFYKWNIEHNKGLSMEYNRDKPRSLFNIDLDFIETSRCSANAGGAGFGPNGYGYRWNVTKENIGSGWLTNAGVIHFDTKSAKNNFAKWWYNGKKWESFASKVALGTKISNMIGKYFFFIPQIGWSNIHINQKELWDKGDYDNAVLSEMELKFDENGVIVKC